MYHVSYMCMLFVYFVKVCGCMNSRCNSAIDEVVGSSQCECESTDVKVSFVV